MATKKLNPKASADAVRDPAIDVGSVEAQLTSFTGKFEPDAATLIRQCRAELRKLLPTAVELVYDNYNFFVIGYASTERASDCIVSLAAAQGKSPLPRLGGGHTVIKSISAKQRPRRKESAADQARS